MAKGPKQIAVLTHEDARRANLPTAELQPFLDAEADAKAFPPAAFERRRPLAEGKARERDPDLDPQLIWNGARIRLSPSQLKQLTETGEVEIGDAQLVWRGKDRQDWSDLVVAAPPIYVQEKIHPKAIVDDLKKATARKPETEVAPDLFADFNGVPVDARTEFYQHEAHWTNRMILGDSLQVMASLAEREKLKGRVQCVYFDPPYGIKFNSNWQVSTQSRDVKDNKREDVSREPEQVKAFRDTWKDGIHSYLTYLRDRLTVARELLTDSGSIFVQISDENVHRVRALMDEVFGSENFVVTIVVKKKGSQVSKTLEAVNDHIIWYSRRPKDSGAVKVRQLFDKIEGADVFSTYNMVELPGGERLTIGALSARDGNDYAADVGAFRERYPTARLFALNPLKSGGFRKNQSHDLRMWGRVFPIGTGNCWKHTVVDEGGGTPGMERLRRANKLYPLQNDVRFVRYAPEPAVSRISNWWDRLGGASSPVYVVQTNTELVKRCVLMTTDPGDIVLDPTCGSGTTAYVAEQWGRRWITIDTSRVALALTRTRLMGAQYPYYLLADSEEGRRRARELSGAVQAGGPPLGDVRQGFVYDRTTWNTSGSIANNAEVDLLWDKWQAVLEPLRDELNRLLDRSWEEWEIPRDPVAAWPEPAKVLHKQWWDARVARQKEIDASIAKAADVELLYDRPYTDPNRVRVAGPFTVESLSPHRGAPEADMGEDLEAAEGRRLRGVGSAPPTDFAAMVLETLKTAGVQGRDKQDRVRFSAVQPWPGRWIGGEGRYLEGPEGTQVERRAAVFIGPEYGTVSRPDLVAAAREAAEARFDLMVACAFAYDAHSSELTQLGALPILQAKMNPDLHMAEDLKNTGKGNLFTVFGEPDVEVERLAGDMLRVRVNGVDVYDPNTGEVRSNDTKGIAAWFVDTDYDEESFFVRHAYFLGAGEPYKALANALKAEIDQAAWASLYRDTSRPFPRPGHGRIAVKVINHFGDEVMKVERV